MNKLYRALMLLIASATQKELARHVRFLKAENQMLRSRLPPRLILSTKEKNRLVRLAAKLGRALDCLATIVQSGHDSTLGTRARKKGKALLSGRRKTRLDMCKLILKLARENDTWGYARIMGEIKKMGLTPPTKNTVKRILRENGFDPSPKRGEGTWDEFLGSMPLLCGNATSLPFVL